MSIKKILFITSNLGIGGAQQHLIEFANYLVNKEYKVLILNTDLNNDFLYRLDSKVTFKNIPRKYNFDLAPSKEIFSIAKSEGFKKVFCDSLFSLIYARQLSKLNGVDVYVMFHTTNYVDNYNYFKDLVARVLIRKNVKLIAVSQNQINRLAKVLLLNKTSFKLIYNGIDDNKFNFQKRLDTDRNKMRQEIGIADDAFVIVKTARFAVEKNHELAIEVLELLRNTYNINAVMLFVGNTNKDRMNMVMDLAKSKNIEAYVKMVGNQKNVIPFLAISDLFVLTSKSVETFSIAALEAMGLGLPAVLTNIGGANEMILPGINGYLAPFDNKEEFAKRVSEVYEGKLKMNNQQVSAHTIETFNISKTNLELENYIFS